MRVARLAGWTILTMQLLSSAVAGEASRAKTNVVANGVRGVAAWYSTEARLLAIVVDHEGRGLEGIDVAVIARDGSEVASGPTKADGRLLLNVAVLGRSTVRASHVGFVTAEARGVELSKSSLTAVALPLEVAEVTDPLTSR